MLIKVPVSRSLTQVPGPESLGSSNQYSPLGSNANCVCLVCAGGDEVAQQAIMRRLLLLLLLRKEETLQEHSRTKEVRRVKERKREERRERGRVCVCVCVVASVAANCVVPSTVPCTTRERHSSL